MNRLQTLTNRYDRLLEANVIHGFVRTQTDRYFAVLLAIKKERAEIMRANDRKLNKSGYKFTMTMSDLNALCNPNFS